MSHKTTWSLSAVAAVTACLFAVGPGPAVAHPPADRPSFTSISLPTPGAVKTAFGSVWVANGPARTVTRLDPRTNAVIARIPTPDPASVIGVGAGAIWLTSFPGNSLTRIDPGRDRVTRTISLAPGGAGPIGACRPAAQGTGGAGTAAAIVRGARSTCSCGACDGEAPAAAPAAKTKSRSSAAAR